MKYFVLLAVALALGACSATFVERPAPTVAYYASDEYPPPGYTVYRVRTYDSNWNLNRNYNGQNG